MGVLHLNVGGKPWCDQRGSMFSFADSAETLFTTDHACSRCRASLRLRSPALFVALVQQGTPGSLAFAQWMMVPDPRSAHPHTPDVVTEGSMKWAEKKYREAKSFHERVVAAVALLRSAP